MLLGSSLVESCSLLQNEREYSCHLKMIQVIDNLRMLVKGFDLELLFHWFSCSLFGVLVFPLWSGKVGASKCICVYEMGKHPWSLPEWVRMDILNCVFELRQTEILWVKVTLLAKLQNVVRWYSCSMFILLQYSFVFFVENRWGSLPKSFRSNYKNTEVVGENYMLCYYVGSPEVCL